MTPTHVRWPHSPTRPSHSHWEGSAAGTRPWLNVSPFSRPHRHPHGFGSSIWFHTQMPSLFCDISPTNTPCWVPSGPPQTTALCGEHLRPRTFAFYTFQKPQPYWADSREAWGRQGAEIAHAQSSWKYHPSSTWPSHSTEDQGGSCDHVGRAPGTFPSWVSDVLFHLEAQGVRGTHRN